MKTSPRFGALLCAFLFISTISIFAQGLLTPPGAPAPTMKTLDQVEARTPIDATHTPGDATNQFIISTGGSYYLTGNIAGVSGKNGIAIAADNVTLNLNGFALVGVSGSGIGILVTGAHQNLAVHNGIVRGWNQSGIDSTSANNAQFTSLELSGNGASGLFVGSNSFVRGCVASGNFHGIRTNGSGTRIEDNNCTSNVFGFHIDTSGNLVIKNNAASNSAIDYYVAVGTNFGQIVQTPGVNFSATAWANFSSSCPSGQVFCSGVCTNLSNNPNNCGACGNVCTAANATTGCTSGNCVIASCNSGFGNCNGQYSDGCETDLTTSNSNCGACGNSCPPATPICTNSVCHS